MVVGARIFVLFLVACGVETGEAPVEIGDDGKEDNGETPMPQMPMTATEFLGKLGTQYCDECFRCKATYPAGPAAFATDFGTQMQCYAAANAFYMPQLVEQGIKAGRILYNAAAAKACADGVRYEQNCNTFWQTDPAVPVACGAVFLGTVPDGGACVTEYDCSTSAARCDQATKKCVR